MIDAEANLIGCVVLGDCAGEVFTRVTESEIKNESYHTIFCTFRKVWQERGRCDASDLGRLSDDLKVIGYKAAEQLIGTNPEPYIQALKEHNAIMLAAAVADKLAIASDMESIRGCAEELLNATQETTTLKAETVKELSVKFLQTKNKPRSYIRSGFSRLDRYTYIDKGDYVVIGARPSNGKTALGICLAANYAKQGYNVGFFSLETSNEKVYDRLVSSVAGLHYSSIKQQKLSADDWATYADSLDVISSLPITIIPTAGKTVEWIRAESLRCAYDVVLVDYLGLIHSSGKDIREQVTRTSRSLHELAQSNKKLVIALCQLNRAGAAGEPKLTDLREAGEIEENADLVLLIHNPPSEETFRECQLIIAKNKDGIAGVSDKMQFEGRYQRFTEVVQ